MRALITGDKGFLGRHFRAELVRRDYEVHGLDTAVTPSQDCRDYFRECLRRGMEPGAWDLVVHCAAVVGGREMIENNPLATAESLSIDAEMFRWAAVARPKRVIYLSSSAAYPVHLQGGGPVQEVDQVQLTESDVRLGRMIGEPDQIYGWSKVIGELLAAELRKTGVPVTVVRPFSGYGGDQDPSYPFRAILDRVRAREKGRSLMVWCGDCVRDWVHVDDVVNATLAVAESGTGDPVNICTGRPTSFYDLARLMLDADGQVDRGILADPDKPQGVAYRVGDPTRLLEYYTPQVSLEQGIIRALES
jgi:nucleoside-diphosphate-sugar epimerase